MTRIYPHYLKNGAQPPAKSKQGVELAGPPLTRERCAACDSTPAHRARSEDKSDRARTRYALVANVTNGLKVSPFFGVSTDRQNDRVQIFDADGNFLEQWTDLGRPYGLAIYDGKVFVADGVLGRVAIADLATGKLVDVIEGAEMAHGIEVGPMGNVYVASNRRFQPEEICVKQRIELNSSAGMNGVDARHTETGVPAPGRC